MLHMITLRMKFYGGFMEDDLFDAFQLISQFWFILLIEYIYVFLNN